MMVAGTSQRNGLPKRMNNTIMGVWFLMHVAY